MLILADSPAVIVEHDGDKRKVRGLTAHWDDRRKLTQIDPIVGECLKLGKLDSFTLRKSQLATARNGAKRPIGGNLLKTNLQLAQAPAGVSVLRTSFAKGKVIQDYLVPIAMLRYDQDDTMRFDPVIAVKEWHAFAPLSEVSLHDTTFVLLCDDQSDAEKQDLVAAGVVAIPGARDSLLTKAKVNQ